MDSAASLRVRGSLSIDLPQPENSITVIALNKNLPLEILVSINSIHVTGTVSHLQAMLLDFLLDFICFFLIHLLGHSVSDLELRFPLLCVRYLTQVFLPRVVDEFLELCVLEFI